MHSRPRWQRTLDIVLSTDPKLRQRTGMSLLALVLMASSAMVMLLVGHAGVAPLRWVQWWAVVSIAGLALMLVLIRLRCTLHLDDPGLDIPQMAWTITSGAVAYVLAGEARGIVPSVLAMILFFGTFGLTVRQVIGIGLYALANFALAVALVGWLGDAQSGVLDTAYALMVAIVLGGCMALNMRIQHIRARLRQQRAELAQALADIRMLATRDELTGLLNRRAMLDLMQLEQRRNQRTGRNLLLALLDLDHFKAINDTHGHAAGDRALQAFTTTVRATVRGTDVLARWGGEEFVLMLCETPCEHAADLLERVRCAVAVLAVPHAPVPLTFTVSIGLAEHCPSEPLEATLERADRALYAAKAAGRDRVVVSPLPAPHPAASAPAPAGA